MDSVQKSVRSGVDIRVALSSSSKTTAPASDQRSNSSTSAPGPAGLRASLKKMARKVVRFGFRAVKPVVRPIAFRFRAYLTAPLQQEVQHFHLRTSRDLEHHARQQRQLVERLLSMQTAAILQTLQASRKSPEAVNPPSSLVLQLRDTHSPMRKILRPGDTFVDMGSGVDAHALAAHLALDGQGQILAFGPLAAAHSAKRGALRIDDMIDDDTRVDLIRIDATSVGPETLEGAARTIASNQHIAVIIDFGRLPSTKPHEASAEWQSLFETRGFECAVLDFGSDTRSAHPSPATAQALSGMLLFARPGSSVWTRVGGGE